MQNVTATHILIGTAGGLAVLATLGLWARYGEAVYVDTLLAAIGGCFY
jgi:hypothetical protein